MSALLLAFVVTVVATVSLALAYVGHHHLWLVLPISAVVLGGLLFAMRRQLAALPFVRWSTGAWFVLPAIAAVFVLSFPGFHYATGDKDPGIYVMHATTIADTGDIYIHSTDMQRAKVFTSDDLPGTQWRGFEPMNADGTITPSFYHLWPALLANAFEAVGFRAIAVALPLLGLLSALLMFALTRRLAPPWAAGIGALILATNMMQVWQTRYPTTEVLAQVLYLGAALAFVLAMQTRVLPLALASGLMITAGFLNRGEGVLIVLLGLLGAAVAIACNLRRQLALWFAMGILVPLPFAWIQAYKVALRYSQGNAVPGSTVVLGVVAVSFVVAAVGMRSAFPARAWAGVTGWVSRPRTALWIRCGLSALFIGLFILSGIRPWFGEVTAERAGEIIRTFDERTLHRLAMYFGWPALALFMVGLVWAIWARWSAARSLLVTLGAAFTVLFLYRAKNSPQMMWWGRRFIPVVVPTMVLLMAFAVCAAMSVPKWRKQMVALVALILLATVAFQGRQSWALRHHDEKAGSYGVALAVADVAPNDDGVFLWQNGPCCGAPVLLFGSPTWIFGGADSARLPRKVEEWSAFLPPVVAAAGDRPVYLVLNGEGQVPADLPYVVTQTARITGALPVWEESNIARPSRAIEYPYDLVIYKIEP